MTLDLQYIKTQSFFTDIKLLINTIGKVIRRKGISEEGMETVQDLGDYLLRNKKVDISTYNECNKNAEKIIIEGMQH